jgi:hypothetical protein
MAQGIGQYSQCLALGGNSSVNFKGEVMNDNTINNNRDAEEDLEFITGRIKLILHLLDLNPEYVLEHIDPEVSSSIAKALSDIINRTVEVELRRDEYE